jgi:hypothetical protein
MSATPEPLHNAISTETAAEMLRQGHIPVLGKLARYDADDRVILAIRDKWEGRVFIVVNIDDALTPKRFKMTDIVDFMIRHDPARKSISVPLLASTGFTHDAGL